MNFDHVAQQVADIAAAVDWWQKTIPGTEILYQDETWALLEANGVKLALVTPNQHPNHLAWRVSADELERLAKEHGAIIADHRDSTRSFYLNAPGDISVEIISYPADA